MKLHELLDSAYEWDGLKKEHPDEYTAHFEDGKGEDVEVIFTMYKGMWDIEFSRAGYGMTGGGDAIKIFSTVLAIIKEFIESVDPKYIIFSAKSDEESRIKFYKRFAKKIEAFGYTEDAAGGSEGKYGEAIKQQIQRDGNQYYFLVRN